ncbi:amidase domain-containing protein [Streptomyces sp. NPDC050658]|uniref:amidase domain-containing protein n=1 Tax=unclassified Streptomyces TaxID=2593676 RepID=UPI00341E8B5D
MPNSALVAATALAMLAGTAPFTMASTPATTPPPGGDDQVMQVVKEYFIERDKGWLNPQPALVRDGELDHGSTAEQPRRAARDVARIAQETRRERGLQAKKVLTGFADDNDVRTRGNTATVTVSTGTFLAWNNEKLGTSEVGDSYKVKLRHQKDGWQVTHVAAAPIPSTEGNDGPVIDVDDEVPAARSLAAEEAEKKKQKKRSAAEPQPRAAGTYNREKASNYASYWSGEWLWSEGLGEYVYSGGNYNPDYEKYDNDCANLASQALHAGGWPKKPGSGWFQDPADPAVWSDNISGIRGPAYNWTKASWLHSYSIESARGVPWRSGSPADTEDIWLLQPGDLLFADWDPDGHYDGNVDHAMFISDTYTELGFTEPAYSQHTPHRKNLPLSIGIKMAVQEQHRSVIYHPVHIKDSFTD